ncbi:hypothetical protein HF086_002990 [Spodoptera exigua]|uniref:Uncharacterized protein n=1 Tax=Spodoptera exigua TaxID=7107 RepID=A0A922MUR8_SPOEX|nr:hypothetical protein HF086_002990 [Spodoptera exigua]
MSGKPPPAPAPKFNLLPKIVNGGIAGIVGVSIVFPIDLVKTRLQNQTIGPNGERQYKSMTTMKHEGPLAFFKGGACRMMVIAPLFGIAQTVYYLGIAEYLLGYKRDKIV